MTDGVEFTLNFSLDISYVGIVVLSTKVLCNCYLKACNNPRAVARLEYEGFPLCIKTVSFKYITISTFYVGINRRNVLWVSVPCVRNERVIFYLP
jgi:hypothetical protein